MDKQITLPSIRVMQTYISPRAKNQKTLEDK